MSKIDEPIIIAIDGPAASGKSTLAERISNILGFFYFDSGLMYRAVTHAALEAFGSVENEEKVSNLAEKIKINVRPASIQDGRVVDVMVDDVDVTWQIRTPIVDQNVSPVSAYPGVRTAMTEHQRRIGYQGNTIMAGRDIGTVVFPDAKYKFYLDASPEERAKRRYKEIQSRGGSATYDEILESIIRRDKIDTTRKCAPLMRAKDAIILDSDGKSIDEVVEEALTFIHTK